MHYQLLIPFDNKSYLLPSSLSTTTDKNNTYASSNAKHDTNVSSTAEPVTQKFSPLGALSVLTSLPTDDDQYWNMSSTNNFAGQEWEYKGALLTPGAVLPTTTDPGNQKYYPLSDTYSNGKNQTSTGTNFPDDYF